MSIEGGLHWRSHNIPLIVLYPYFSLQECRPLRIHHSTSNSQPTDQNGYLGNPLGKICFNNRGGVRKGLVVKCLYLQRNLATIPVTSIFLHLLQICRCVCPEITFILTPCSDVSACTIDRKNYFTCVILRRTSISRNQSWKSVYIVVARKIPGRSWENALISRHLSHFGCKKQINLSNGKSYIGKSFGRIPLLVNLHVVEYRFN